MATVDCSRRRLLQGGLAAGTLLLSGPAGRAWAQSPSTVLSLPKVALVVGNSTYKQAPLKNPANDAKAMGEALKQTGFDVTVKLDAGRAEMLSAIQAYAQTLAKKKCVGLFYFAGHGVQLVWKNYLIPADAVVEKTEDIQAQAVEVNDLLAGLTQAANPMNLIILDACRDDPFGAGKNPDQKGLSQMDAPPSTLLAYATSPGNTAGDGDGANGLYTEHLLKELKAQGAKVEDVFKRVRLAVRRRSNGQQIPWESTSLEDDFYFVLPQHLKKLSDDEKEKRFKEELGLWEKVQKSAEPGPLEDYLRRYPSGNFAELAQLQLERVLAKQGEKKIQIASAEGNPFTKGSAVANTNRKVGDSYTYRELDLESRKSPRTYTITITQITDAEVIFDNGSVTDLLGNVRRTPDGWFYSANQNIPLEYVVGKQWSSRFVGITPQRGVMTMERYYKIVTRESITVPAGTFNAFRLEGSGRAWGGGPPGDLSFKAWFDPDKVRVRIAYETVRRVKGRPGAALRGELVSYKES